MSYVEGFLLAVPDQNKDMFIEHARSIDAFFLEYGAIRVMECWGEDVPVGKITDFRRAVRATDGESVVFSWIEWPDKATRDLGMSRLHDLMVSDPRFDPATNPIPYDGSRMVFGGFQSVVELTR